MSEKDFNLRRDILKHEAQAIVSFLMQHSVGILMPEKKQDNFIPQGSGTCIVIGEHFLVATAAHVLKDFEDDDLWIVHAMEPTDIRPPILGTDFQGGSEYDPIDVAWIEMDRQTAIKTGKTFLKLDQLRAGVSHVGDDLVVLNGYPGVFTEEHGIKLVSAQSMSFIGGTILPSAWPPSTFDDLGCTPEDYFLLTSYPDEGNHLISGEPYQVPDPHGMSGGGLWQVFANPVKADGLWSTKLARLIGINLEWNPHDQWVSANQIQYWLRLVAEDFPDVAAEIKQHLDVSNQSL